MQLRQATIINAPAATTTVIGLSEGMHLAHLHRFASWDPQQARCPGRPAA